LTDPLPDLCPISVSCIHNHIAQQARAHRRSRARYDYRAFCKPRRIHITPGQSQTPPASPASGIPCCFFSATLPCMCAPAPVPFSTSWGTGGSVAQQLGEVTRAGTTGGLSTAATAAWWPRGKTRSFWCTWAWLSTVPCCFDRAVWALPFWHHGHPVCHPAMVMPQFPFRPS
jgi:hypothetical protein